MSSFLEIFQLASSSPDNDIRQLNEKKLIHIRQTEPITFLTECVNAFTNTSIEPSVKQSIGTILRISLTSEIVSCFYSGTWTRNLVVLFASRSERRTEDYMLRKLDQQERIHKESIRRCRFTSRSLYRLST